MINLRKLELRNFLSHVETSLPLEEYKGLVLIEGKTEDGHYSSNGSGKSTLLEGIVYALTGDTLRGVSVNDVVNRNYKKDTKVSLSFSQDDHSYEVNRYRKDQKFGDSILLSKDGEDISKRVNKQTQESLEDILGISYKILVSTMLLGEGLSSRFTQLSDPEKKSLIESTLNLNYDFSAIRAKANSELSRLKLEKSHLEGRLSTLRELSSFDVESSQKLLSDYEANTAKAGSELELLQASLASMRDEYESLMKKLNILSNSITQRDNLESEMNKLNAEYFNYLKELEKLEEAEVPHCAICHQALVSEDSREAYRNTYKERIDDIVVRLENVRSTLSNLPERDILSSKYEELLKSADAISNNITPMNDEVSELANIRWSNQSQADRLREDIKRYEESISDISSLESENDSLSNSIARYDYFYKLFSPTGIIVNVLSEAIDYINTRLATYSEVLLEKDYHIEFVKGKISLSDSKGSSYQSLSNGEKRRLDISIQFALHDYVHMYCGLQMDCCFIDEILDTLDDIGVENIFDVLRLKLEYCNLRSIYVITHNDSLKNKFDQIITVKKDATGDSRLE